MPTCAHSKNEDMRGNKKHKCIKVYTTIKEVTGNISVATGWVGIIGLVYCAVAVNMVKDMRHHYRRCK